MARNTDLDKAIEDLAIAYRRLAESLLGALIDLLDRIPRRRPPAPLIPIPPASIIVDLPAADLGQALGEVLATIDTEPNAFDDLDLAEALGEVLPLDIDIDGFKIGGTD